MPPASEVIDIACQAQQRVEASVPAPPPVSRTPSFSSLQQQLVPESTRQTIEMVLSSTAQSPSKLLQFGRNIVSQKLKSGLAGGWQGAVVYRPSDSPSPGGSFEHLPAPQPAEANVKASSQTDISNHMDSREASTDQQMAEVNLIDLSFDDSGNNLVTFGNDVHVQSESTVADNSVHVQLESAVHPEKESDQELVVVDDPAENHSTVTSQSDISSGPPAILLNDAEASSVRADRPLCRRHSLLKMSHSESSLSMSLSTPPPGPQTATSADDLLTVRELDLLDDVDLATSSATGGVSGGFSRLLQGGKLAASLMVPRGTGISAAAAATRRRQLEEMAKSRLAKSQLRFKECRTRIILL